MLVWLLWVGGAGAQGGDEPVGLSEYRARLDQVIQALEEAPDGEPVPALEAAQRQLAALKVVQLPSGETIEVQQAFTDDALTEALHPTKGRMMQVKKVFTPADYELMDVMESIVEILETR